MVIRTRTELIEVLDTVELTAAFRDGSGNLVDTDSYPQVSIRQPSGAILVGPTSQGVQRLSIGKYQYSFTVPFGSLIGVYNDLWQTTINGFEVDATFSFVVLTTDVPAINSDGYYHLGDDPGFDYSQTAIFNINKLLKALKARLRNTAKVKVKDIYGNDVFIDCAVFQTDILVDFLAMALTDFNQVPYLTFFTFEDTDMINLFLEVLVEAATIYALGSQAIIERGAEFNITDNGINFVPPTLSEILQTQYSALMTQHWDKLKYIKNSLRPSPRGLGTLRPLAANPAFLRLRHLRARRFF